MLPLVLRDHAHHIRIAQQRRLRVEGELAQASLDQRTNAGQLRSLIVERGERKRAARRTRMLERIVRPRHFGELDRAVDVAEQPEALERRDVFNESLDWSHVLFFFQAEDGIRDWSVTGVQTCALPI